jgi:hypothetical protein
MGWARPNLSATDTLDTTVKVGKRLGPAKRTKSAASKSTDDRLRRAHFEQDHDPNRRVTTIDGSRDLKALFCRTIKVCADQNHMWSECCDHRQNIEGGCKSDYFKAWITPKRLREKLVAHPVSISDQNSDFLPRCRIVRRLRTHCGPNIWCRPSPCTPRMGRTEVGQNWRCSLIMLSR